MAHPTGRLIGKREGINANWEKVFHFIKENNQALEINSSPARLDLPDNLVYEVQKKDLLFIINTDAHEASNMDLMEYGVSVARRGWLPPDKVVNTWSLEKFSEWIIY